MNHTAINETTFVELLDTVLTDPGVLSTAYSAFHNYSLGNQLLAMMQCEGRGIPVGPLSTFNGWKDKGRFVKKGSKALQLCMPVTVKRTTTNEAGEEEDIRFAKFIYPSRWFVLSQTDGAEYVPVDLPKWNEEAALTTLDITRIPYDLMDGNCQGYAVARKIAVSDIAVHPHKTLFHEIAHVILGHTSETALLDDDRTPRSLREVEAESVAFLVGTALGLPGAEESRGYIQHWNANRDNEAIPEASARRIFKAATQILEAGKPKKEVAE